MKKASMCYLKFQGVPSRNSEVLFENSNFTLKKKARVTYGCYLKFQKLRFSQENNKCCLKFESSPFKQQFGVVRKLNFHPTGNLLVSTPPTHTTHSQKKTYKCYLKFQGLSSKNSKVLFEISNFTF